MAQQSDGDKPSAPPPSEDARPSLTDVAFDDLEGALAYARAAFAAKKLSVDALGVLGMGFTDSAAFWAAMKAEGIDANDPADASEAAA